MMKIVSFCLFFLRGEHCWHCGRRIGIGHKSGVSLETGRTVERNCEHFKKSSGSRDQGREESEESEAKTALVHSSLCC